MKRVHGKSMNKQRGVSLLVVIVLFAVMLLAAVALGRLTQTGVLVAGNVADKDRALQASEVGINTAYEKIRRLVGDQPPAGSGAWYFGSMQAPTVEGLPSGVDWEGTPKIAVGVFTVSYVVERMCAKSDVTDPAHECLVVEAPGIQSSKVGSEEYEAPTATQYRITVRVGGPRNTLTFVQSLVSRGT